MNSKEIEKKIDEVKVKQSDPKTPQGDIKMLNQQYYDLKRQFEIVKREEYEADTGVEVYGSDDYVGASAGDTSFYFGYEATKCPVKSHKTEDDCDNHDCDKREWLFQVEKNGEVVFEMSDSELSHPEADVIERKLIIGMAHYVKMLL